MEILISAVLSELTTRSINFFISKLSKPKPQDVENRLHRVLLRAQVIMNEAMGRQITNQAMLLQLNMLRDAMHWGNYAIDTFRSYQCHNKARTSDQDVSHSSSLSKLNSAKYLSDRGVQDVKELQEALDSLSSMILDVNELMFFLTSYPRLCCQPYSMHLQLANSMFGRQMETQQVINFLLHTQPNGDEDLEVLPIVGPGQVGKSTLVAHVCKDERVRSHFSDILIFCIHGFKDDEVDNFQKGCVVKHQNHMSRLSIDRRLIVVELIGDISEDAWNRLYCASKQCVPSGSKIIVTSRSERIVKFGTTGAAITLKHLSREAYWYFFKTLTFESIDPEMHPRLIHLAMEIVKTLTNSLIGANVTARLLRDNFNVQFWSKVLTFLRGFIQRHVSRFGEHPINFLCQNRVVHLARMATPYEEFIVHHQYQSSPAEDIPQIRFQDVMYGNVKPHGKFEILAWKSQIPPYYSFICTCEIRELKTTASKRKRSAKNGITLC